MQSILDAITEWIKEILIGAINGNLSTMFGDVNEKVGTIAAEVGQTPQGWNAGIFNMIRTLSENVIVPIAGLVITYVLCVELISMVTEKNNMHDVDTFMFFKWFFKAWVAVYLVTHTFDITMATMTNREWGQIGNNYLKSLFAIGFQGFLIMICVGIYAVLVNSMIVADNLHSAIFSLAAYTVILCFSLFKSGALAKSIFAAH